MSDELETLRAEVERLRVREQMMREALREVLEMDNIISFELSTRGELEWMRLIDKVVAALATDAGSTLPSVAGHMEMTHQDFQRACQVELGRLERDPNCDNALVRLLCEAVRCSRECCELAKSGLEIPSTLLTREAVKPLMEALTLTWEAVKYRGVVIQLSPSDHIAIRDSIEKALAHARTLGFTTTKL